MSEKEINVVGIMISANPNDYQLCHMDSTISSGNNKGVFGSKLIHGYRHVVSFLANHLPDNAEFIVVYDVSCTNKKEHITSCLEKLPKSSNGSLPVLIAIGHEQFPLGEEITTQVSNIKEVVHTKTNSQLLNYIVEIELRDRIKDQERLFCLEKKQTEFNNQLNIIRVKSEQLRKDGHLVAAKAATALYEKLTESSKTYLANPTEQAYINFKNQAKNDINEAHKELDKHRGWKRVLGNILLAILGFGILYLAALAMNKNLFFNKTDSADKLDNLENYIDSSIHQPR
ncbi:hypothetical protein [Legionella worsleiensis]|uniref:Effector protein B, substrate of the Dot/Icm secretion system n=1 Tax=Legionella worsleiensis TaxID=45076 RepID=A0A0W1A6K7_9GAMM|nr:hypothetical protein [Legionella worsleiensis]KTD76832.1 effector protein B, substrate of the Dot/Icm secretion system [Legionella worsleiensis]STY30706.1 LepB protein [Legionella worsleiensis]